MEIQCARPVLEVNGVSKTYRGKKVLSNISFRVQAGTIVAVIGDNGAGKSTLLEILADSIRCDEGTVLLNGENAGGTAAQRHIGYVPQEIVLHANLSVKDNLLFWAAANGLSRKQAKIECARIASIFFLNDHMGMPVRRLSGGVKRRLNIAAALFNSPQLLLLDEPTAGIDISVREEILQLLQNFKQHGMTIIYVTHLADEIHRLADMVLHLRDGCQIFYGAVTDWDERRC